jgi:hypothetical protein
VHAQASTPNSVRSVGHCLAGAHYWPRALRILRRLYEGPTLLKHQTITLHATSTNRNLFNPSAEVAVLTAAALDGNTARTSTHEQHDCPSAQLFMRKASWQLN